MWATTLFAIALHYYITHPLKIMTLKPLYMVQCEMERVDYKLHTQYNYKL